VKPRRYFLDRASPVGAAVYPRPIALLEVLKKNIFRPPFRISEFKQLFTNQLKGDKILQFQ
jgi:hypothetical protein